MNTTILLYLHTHTHTHHQQIHGIFECLILLLLGVDIVLRLIWLSPKYFIRHRRTMFIVSSQILVELNLNKVQTFTTYIRRILLCFQALKY